MDGIHDLGGKKGFGRIDRTGADEVFHDRWEASVFAMTGAAGVAGASQNTDQFRHAIERIDPQAYLVHGYYGRWLGAVETLMVEAGLVTQEEITNRALKLGAQRGDLVAARPARHPDPQEPRSGERTAAREINQSPRFQVGDTVVTDSTGKPGHTRLPGYARGRWGTVVAVHGGWVYPDTNAHGLGEQPQHLYTVCFSSEELWQTAGFSVNLDLFEPYLTRHEQD